MALWLRRWPCAKNSINQSINQSMGIDAMLHPCDNMSAYAFPPLGMIHEVGGEIRSSRNLQVTLIAPFWPQKVWCPDLHDHLV